MYKGKPSNFSTQRFLLLVLGPLKVPVTSACATISCALSMRVGTGIGASIRIVGLGIGVIFSAWIVSAHLGRLGSRMPPRVSLIVSFNMLSKHMI